MAGAEAAPMDHGHLDVIQDVSFNYYGKRVTDIRWIATCSGDHTVKIYDIEDDGRHVQTGDFKPHCGSVLRVAWAHPEYGSVLASCSEDSTVEIWEEQVGRATGSEQLPSEWVHRARLTDSRTSITGIQFAPRQLDLKLATCAKDGQVRLYEAMDVMNLSSWSHLEDFKVRGKGQCNCLSWNPARGYTMLALGCSSDAKASNLQVWELGGSKRWTSVIDSQFTLDVAEVNDVAFAPSMGRGYFLLAAACGDGSVRIWKIRPTSTPGFGGADAAGDQARQQRYDCEEVLNSSEHGERVHRVSWNVTGTKLASTAEDGSVKLWRTDLLGQWRVSEVPLSERD